MMMFRMAALCILWASAFGACSARPTEAQLQKRAGEITKSLSLETKVGQLFHLGFPGPKLSAAARSSIKRIRPGGVILFGHNLVSAEQIRALNADLQSLAIEASGIPLLVSTDQEGGRVFRVPEDVMPVYPGAMGLGQSGDADLARDVGFATGYHLRAVGINVVLAPVMDVNNNPENPVINTRSFGSDPATVALMATALAAGIRESGAIPVIKHFPGHGDTNVDSHLDLPHIDRSEGELEKVELQPFRRGIQDGAEIVMTAHILFPQLDRERPATLSPRILREILRRKLGFKGIIMTDAMEMYAVARRYPYEKSVRMAIEAGVDVILLTGMGPYVETMYGSLLKAFQKGDLPMELLDRAVERQIALKLERSLFVRHAGARPAPTEKERRWAAECQEDVARRLAAMEKKYADRKTTLAEFSARASVASLRKAFPGLPVKTSEVRVFAGSPLTATLAFELGVPKSSVANSGPAGAASEFARWHTRSAKAVQGSKRSVWVVELRRGQVVRWNALVRALDRAKTPPTLVGVYPDSPFTEILVPKDGYLLASFSPTKESRRGLLFRALSQKPVSKATVTLPPLSTP